MSQTNDTLVDDKPDNGKKHGGGPKTPEGKARSSQNANRHSLTGNTVVIDSEEKEQWDTLLADYIRELRPVGHIELDIVHEIVVCRWRMQRIWGMERNVYNLTMDRMKHEVAAEFTTCEGIMRHTVAFMKLSNEDHSLELLHRYETRHSRRIDQLRRELAKLQNQREAEAAAEKSANFQTNSPASCTRPEEPPKQAEPTRPAFIPSPGHAVTIHLPRETVENLVRRDPDAA